jgi:protein O-mannosyl-transferase
MKASKKINVKSENKTENNPDNKTYLLYFLLLATFILFWNTMGHQFTNWDDNEYITDNPLIKDGSLQGFLNLFTTHYSNNYHPLTALSNWLEFKFWGLNPKPFHFFNIVLHVLNVFLVYHLILALKNNTSIALFTATLFAIHPMHVESVAWLAERKDLLYTCFALLSLRFYIRYLNESRKKYLYWAGMCFVLSLLSKSAAVILPLLFVIIDYYKERSITLKTLLEKIPFFMVSLLFAIITLKTQTVGMQMAQAYTLTEHFFLVNYCISFYIIKVFFPFNLSALHSYPPGGYIEWQYLSPLLIGIIIFVCFKVKKLRREITFGMLFYLVSILLVIQIIPVGDASVAERYSYLSYVGLFFILAAIYVESIERIPQYKIHVQALLACIIITLAFLTWNRNKVWKNDLTLWENAIKNSPGSKRAYINLGTLQVKRGDYQEAIHVFSKGIKRFPDYKDLYLSLGTAQAQTEDYNGAISTFSEGIKRFPDYKELYYNRSNAYRSTNNFKSAMADFSVIEKKWPEAAVYSNRGALLNVNNQWAEALKDLDKAIAIDSTQYDFYWERGVSKYNLNDLPGAINDYSKALEHNKDPQIYANRGVAYYHANEKQKACEDWNLAAAMGHEQAKLYLNDYCK